VPRETPIAPIKRQMSAQQRAFFESYIVKHNTIQAYKDAGYVKPNDKRGPDAIKNAAYAVLQGQRIRAALQAHTANIERQAQIEAAMSLDWIVDEHRRLMAKAEESGNLAVATKNLEMIGRTRGIYQDTLTLDVGARQALSEAQEVEARRLAGLLVDEQVAGGVVPGGARSLGTGDVVASDVEPIECEVVGVCDDANDGE